MDEKEIKKLFQEQTKLISEGCGGHSSDCSFNNKGRVESCFIKSVR
jgi:hypothetical protein